MRIEKTAFLSNSSSLVMFCRIAAMVFAAVLFMAAPAPGAMQMIALDVGEGQAVLFEKNGHGLLVDAGPVHRAAEMVRDIRNYGVEQLDWLVLTHLHPDHAGGLFRVIEEWPGAGIVENGHRLFAERVPDLVRWAAQTIDGHDRVEIARAGERLCWQEAQIRFLWPEKITGDNLNRNSLVLSLAYGSRRVLVMGDVGSGVEGRLLAKGVFDKDVDVLVAGHHGSQNTSSAGFLKAVSPVHSIICIDENNFRGYPARQTVERLEKYSKKVHGTWNGDILISLDQ